MGGTAGKFCVGVRTARAAVIGSAVYFSAVVSLAAVTSSTQHGPLATSFDAQMSSSDLIQGRQELDVDVYDQPMDTFGNVAVFGWHPANTNPADQLAAFTDGVGIRSTNLTGLLNDNYPDENRSGRPAKVVEYPFDSPVDIGKINIFTGNRNNADSRIFCSVLIQYSTDNGFNYHELGYFQSDPSGTINSESNPATTFNPPVKSTLLSVFNSSSATLVSGITNLVFNLYSVGSAIDPTDPLRDVIGDQFDGVNPFTNVDDGLVAAFRSPLVFELDVLPPSAPVVGDYNGNGKVDAADYTKWRDTLNANVANGTGADGSGNGVIDQADYNIWKTNFGNGGAGAAASVVPEPAALPLLLTLFSSLACLLGTRRSSWLRA